MVNFSDDPWGYVFLFLAGLAGAFNFKVAYRTLKNGTAIEMLLKENADLKKEIEQLKNDKL
jgi:uncharacterized membrane protein